MAIFITAALLATSRRQRSRSATQAKEKSLAMNEALASLASSTASARGSSARRGSRPRAQDSACVAASASEKGKRTGSSAALRRRSSLLHHRAETVAAQRHQQAGLVDLDRRVPLPSWPRRPRSRSLKKKRVKPPPGRPSSDDSKITRATRCAYREKNSV